MPFFENAIRLPVTEQLVLQAIAKSRQNFFIDNLRSRHINVQFDCKLRGYIGEMAMLQWLADNGIIIEKTNIINFTDRLEVDIDFLYRNLHIELKTSMLPDIDNTIEESIEVRDIKLIKRKNEIEKLKGDLHLQVFFNQKRLAKDEWLELKNINFAAATDMEIYEALAAERFITDTYFVAWIDKPALITYINGLPKNKRQWSFPASRRVFWNCKIRHSKKPADLIEYLKAIKLPGET